MTRRTNKSRVTKPTVHVDGEERIRQHGDHQHTERWCATHKQWEQVD